MSELTYTETIRAAVAIDQAAGRAQELLAGLETATRGNLWAYLRQAVDLGKDLYASLPVTGSFKTSESSRRQSLICTMADSLIRLTVIADYRRGLGEVRDEDDLTTLINRARTTAAQLSVDLGVSLGPTSASSEEGEA